MMIGRPGSHPERDRKNQAGNNWLMHVSRAWVLRATRVCIGRAWDCDVALPDPSVSQRHCVLTCDEDGWLSVDLGSRNGVFVNGERVRRRALSDGDEIRIGRSVFRFRAVH